MGRRFAWSAVGHALLGAAFFWWTGLGAARGTEVTLGLVVALGLLLAFLWLQSRIFQGARWGRAFGSVRVWIALAFFAAAMAVGRMIVLWVPNVPGIGWQLTSLVLRFGLAWILANAAWAAFAWQTTLPEPEDSLASVPRD